MPEKENITYLIAALKTFPQSGGSGAAKEGSFAQDQTTQTTASKSL